MLGMHPRRGDAGDRFDHAQRCGHAHRAEGSGHGSLSPSEKPLLGGLIDE